ncbi:MAG: hypothetical protein ABSA51_02930 [Anaerolineaceae bacterium]|jgi:hypothetical protein
MKALPILLILLAVTACTWWQVTPTATPTPVCACPTGIVDQTQPQEGAAGHASVICNCPAIFVTPAGAGPQAVAPTVSGGGIMVAPSVHP